MKVLPQEKFKMLAEIYDWSLDRAQGFVDGENSRLWGKKPSQHVLIGSDEYSLGFRAGYFERRNVLATRTV